MIYMFRLWLGILTLNKKRGKIEGLDLTTPISFPFINSTLHCGFANSMNNEWGLQSEFFVGKSNNAYCRWSRTLPHYQGFSGIIHGGILTTLADELMANCIVATHNKFGVSLAMNVRWHRPVKVGTLVYGEARIAAKFKNMLLVTVCLESEDGATVLTGNGIFYLPTLRQFAKITGVVLPDQLHSYLRS